MARGLALLDGRLRDYEILHHEALGGQSGPPESVVRSIFLELALKGPSAGIIERLDSIIAHVPFSDQPMVDRPYLWLAATLARSGGTEKARAMIARYKTEITDTSLRRIQVAELHAALGEIALTAKNPREALAEFRLGDVGYDGAPANECAPCLSFDLGRAYDAAGKADSAAMMFEQYLSTPFWDRGEYELDPVRVPAIRERLGQLYESMGKTDKAAENYRAFIDLWKNADPDLQPRVADARRRLLKLTPVEKPRP